MKKIIKISLFVFAFFAIIALAGYIILPKQTSQLSGQLISSTKGFLIDLRGKRQNIKYASYEPKENEIWGIDISHHQKGIDWGEIEKNKPYFVFLKSTEGATHTDTKHKEYKQKFDELSIPSGSYHFFTYTSSGKEQAKHFLRNSNLKKGDLLPVLDVEFKKNMPHKEKVIANINEFIEHIKQETGVVPLIYCECDYYYKYLKGNLKSECQYWISDFWRTPTCDFILWQKTDQFQHNAFNGTIDFNVFTGTVGDLSDLLIK